MQAYYDGLALFSETVGVPAKKKFGGGNEILFKFCNFFPNHNFLVLYG